MSSQQQIPEQGAAAQQAAQQPDERQAEALAAALGVPKEVALAALKRADAAEQIGRVLEVLQRFQSLPGEIRRAIAPVIGGMLVSSGGLGQMVSEILRARLAVELAERLLGDSQPQLLRELSRLTLDLIKSQARGGQDETAKRLERLLRKAIKESRRSPLDRIKEVSELVNAVKALSSLLSPQPNLAEAISVLEKYGFKVVAPQSDVSELIRRAREEAYQQGLKRGFERANVLTKMFAAAMKYLGPELRQLIAAWAGRMLGVAGAPAGSAAARPARVPGNNAPAARQAAGRARQEYPFEV